MLRDPAECGLAPSALFLSDAVGPISRDATVDRFRRAELNLPVRFAERYY